MLEVTFIGAHLPENTCGDYLQISPSNANGFRFCEKVTIMPRRLEFPFRTGGYVEFRFVTRYGYTHLHRGFSLRFDRTYLPTEETTHLAGKFAIGVGYNV